jgi:Zn-dependent peptidase ImmA (M78 family)/transcriptional regulator with XRE-family HTH domain
VAARTKAIVTPALLGWARDTAGLELAEAAERLKLDPGILQAWESPHDEAAPSIPQLRKLAALYRRPLALFYLPQPPEGFQVIQDLRRLPHRGGRRYSPNLRFEMRSALQRREFMLDLLRDLEEKPGTFTAKASLEEDPEKVGTRLRKYLGLEIKDQAGWRDREGRESFNGWRGRMEEVGVLIFQATEVDSEEASGFAVSYDELPIVVVNRKDAVTRRTFSLLHELAHVMLRVSGVSDLDIEDSRPAEEQRIEVFCNNVAAAALIPKDALLADVRVAEKPLGYSDWDDNEIADLARDFGVSREAIVRRLLRFERTTEEFYGRKRAQYLAEFQANRARQKELAEGREITRNMPVETVSNFGRPLVRLVLEHYQQDLIDSQ